MEIENDLFHTMALCFVAPVAFAILISSFNFFSVSTKLSLLAAFAMIAGAYWFVSGGY